MIGIDEQAGFARFLIEEKQVLSRDHFTECIQVQDTMRKLGIEKSIDKVIVEKGYLPKDELASLIKAFRGGSEDLIPGYLIMEKLGEGAMGEVYKAVERENKSRVVAIKILYSHLSKRKATTQRFLQEATICKQKLHHPNIVKGYEVGYDGGKDYYFYVMEYVSGINLRKAIQERGAFPESLVIKIMMQIASALAQAAKFKLVHRDIKPDNIMLTKDENAKLCDLGLARDWDCDLSLTRTGAVMGTPFYISPEAASGSDELDQRSDIYSLGATMYHTLVGQVPFDGKNTMAVLYRHKSEPLIPPIEVRPNISPGISAIIETMMAKSPEDRYQTPVELMADLRRLTAQETPHALVEKETMLEMRRKMGAQQTIMDGLGENTSLPEILNIKDETEERRRDNVEEYRLKSSASHASMPVVEKPKQSGLLSKLLTTSEQKMLANPRTKRKLLSLMIGSVVVVALIIALAFHLVSAFTTP